MIANKALSYLAVARAFAQHTPIPHGADSDAKDRCRFYFVNEFAGGGKSVRVHHHYPVASRDTTSRMFAEIKDSVEEL